MSIVFFTPGPTQLHPQLSSFMQDALQNHIGSISHRSRAFEEIYRTASESLRALLEIPASHQIYFLGSATEAMERIIQGCVRSSSFHLMNGAFSKRFFTIAEELGKEAYGVETDEGAGFDLENIEVVPAAELVCITQNETSTGVALSEEGISAIKLRYPEKLIAVDIVSSAPYCQLNFQYVDCAFFSVQKLFGLPAGLGVLIANSRCIDRAALLAEQGVSIGSYHSLTTLKEFGDAWQTPETPNVLAIYLLGRVAHDYLAAGVDSLRSGIDERAQMLYHFLASGTSLRAGVSSAQDRSNTVIALELDAGDPGALRKWLSSRGYEVGAGYGELKQRQVRVANFPTHTTAQMERLIKALAEWRP